MNVLSGYGDLKEIGVPIITTREAATRLKTSPSNASHALRSMEKANLVRRLRHGLWAIDLDLKPFAAAPYLTAPFPAYVSFWSALAAHDMIEQIPRQISVASLARSREIETPLGTYLVHHLAPEIFDGYEGSATDGYLATPEKAIFDIVYVRAVRRSQAYFPELELPADFDSNKLGAWAESVPSAPLRTLVSKGIGRALALAG